MRFLPVFAAALALLLFPSPRASAQAPVPRVTDAQVQTRAAALQVAGAFSNDGFKIRDGHWWGSLTPKEPKIIQVNLYAGNQYWFVAAVSPETKGLKVAVYDETGKPMATESYQQDGRAAAGFSPTVSGPYYVKVTTEAAEGEPVTFCLLYSYK